LQNINYITLTSNQIRKGPLTKATDFTTVPYQYSIFPHAPTFSTIVFDLQLVSAFRRDIFKVGFHTEFYLNINMINIKPSECNNVELP
jgi:hypothetical protein